MTLLQTTQRRAQGALEDLCRFVRQGRRLGVLLYDDATVRDAEDLIGAIQQTIRSEGGQEIVLARGKTGEASLPSLLGGALDERRRERPFRINLPIFPDGSPENPSPFINRAILWQRLCDRLIEDEEPGRTTLLVLERFDSADVKTQRDLPRLIRFHQFHRIRRSFLLTLHRDAFDSLAPELLDFVEERFEV